MDVVKWVESRAKQWDQYKLIVEDKSTHDQRESECKILQIALQNLENVRKQYSIDVCHRDRQLEDDKIEADFMELRRRVTDRFPREHEAIEIYNMEDPTELPYVIAARSLHPLTGDEVVRFLKRKLETGQAGKHITLDLWARQRGKHKLTRDGVSWKHLPTGVRINGIQKTVHIEGMTLEFVKRISVSDYIVALTVQGNSDMPKIIDLPLRGNPCYISNVPCPGTHVACQLEGNDPPERVKIESGEDIHLIPMALCEPRTNRLLLRCEPAYVPIGCTTF